MQFSVSPYSIKSSTASGHVFNSANNFVPFKGTNSDDIENHKYNVNIQYSKIDINTLVGGQPGIYAYTGFDPRNPLLAFRYDSADDDSEYFNGSAVSFMYVDNDGRTQIINSYIKLIDKAANLIVFNQSYNSEYSQFSGTGHICLSINYLLDDSYKDGTFEFDASTALHSLVKSTFNSDFQSTHQDSSYMRDIEVYGYDRGEYDFFYVDNHFNSINGGTDNAVGFISTDLNEIDYYEIGEQVQIIQDKSIWNYDSAFIFPFYLTGGRRMLTLGSTVDDPREFFRLNTNDELDLFGQRLSGSTYYLSYTYSTTYGHQLNVATDLGFSVGGVFGSTETLNSTGELTGYLTPEYEGTTKILDLGYVNVSGTTYSQIMTEHNWARNTRTDLTSGRIVSATKQLKTKNLELSNNEQEDYKVSMTIFDWNTPREDINTKLKQDVGYVNNGVSSTPGIGFCSELFDYQPTFDTSAKGFVRAIADNATQLKVSDGNITFTKSLGFSERDSYLIPYNKEWLLNGSTHSSMGDTYTLSLRRGGIDYEAITVNTECSDLRFDVNTLIFKDNAGSYVGLPFRGKRQETISSERKSYYQKSGEFTSDDFNLYLTDRGDEMYLNTTKVKYKLFSDWVSDDFSQLMKSCFRSTDVYLDIDDNTYPIIIDTKDIQIKKKDYEDLYIYEISVVVAFDEQNR